MEHPMNPGGRPGPHPILYVLAVLMVANLAASVAIYQRTTGAAGAPAISLPDHLSRSQIDTLAERIVANYQASNWDALYRSFDPLAQVQFTRDSVQEQLELLKPLVGSIERAEYSHFEFLAETPAGNTYKLHYQLQVSGGSFESGVLAVTVVDRGDRIGLYGVFINGSS